MTGGLPYARRLIEALVGLPDYDAYVRHIHQHHPERTPMTRTQFFRERQEARYGGKQGGKCC